MRRLQAAILGQGRSGKDIHARALALLPESYAIAAVVDPLEDRREQARAEYGCRAFASLEELHAARLPLDLVVNATPSHLHPPLSAQALGMGYNVVCDKPLARRVAEVDRLAAAAQGAGRLLAVFQQSRFAPYFRQVRAVADSGVLGRLVFVQIRFNGFARRWDWQTLREMHGGNLLNTGPHPLDQALHFIGRDAMPEVTCTMDRVNTFGDAEDFVKLLLRRKGRPTVDLEISSCCHYNPHTYVIHGERGSLAGSMTRLEWKWFRSEEAPPQRVVRGPMPDRAFCSEALAWHEGAWDVPEEEKQMFDCMATRYYRNLHAHLCAGEPLEVTLAQVRQQVAVIEECHRQNGSYRD